MLIYVCVCFIWIIPRFKKINTLEIEMLGKGNIAFI